MASQTNSGGAGTAAGRIAASSFLTTPIRLDLFSRTLWDLFGTDFDEGEGKAAPPAKIQPVVPTLYPKVAIEAAAPPQPIAAPLRFDARTKSLLLSLQASEGVAGELVQTLLKCEEPPMTPQELARYRAVIQRVTLVARMVDAVETDPHVPGGFKQVFDRLRYTLIKAALADASFLRARNHPLRAISSDLALRAAMSRNWDVSVERELATALDAAVRDFDLSAGFVRPIVCRLQPLDVDAMKEFIEQLHAERREREAAVRAQEQVDQEIEARLRGSVLDERLRFVIEVEWKEVLVHRLRLHGADSVEWRASLAVVEELLLLAAGLQSGAPIPKPLLDRIETGLLEASRPVEPVMKVFERLRNTKPAPSTVATEFARVAMRLSPLSRLMEGFRWFRVFDHGQQNMRWMKTSSYDPSKNIVIFTEIDGGAPLVMHAQQFLDDLKRGISAPNQPDEETTQLLSQLLAPA